MRVLLALLGGFLLVGVYRVCLHAGALLGNELQSVIGQQFYLAPFCVGLSFVAFWQVSKLIFRVVLWAEEQNQKK